MLEWLLGPKFLAPIFLGIILIAIFVKMPPGARQPMIDAVKWILSKIFKGKPGTGR